MPTRQRRSGPLARLAHVAMYAGLAASLGGLAALGAHVSFGARPASLEGWAVLRATCRAIFWPCVFGGLVVTIASGLTLFALAPRRYTRARWFRWALASLAILVPTLHLWGRSRMMAFDRAFAAGRIEDLPALWDAAGTAFWVAPIVLFTAAVLIARAARRSSSMR